METHISKPYNITFHCLYPLEIDHNWLLQFYFQRIEDSGKWQNLQNTEHIPAPLQAEYSQLNYLNYNCLYYPLPGDDFNGHLQEYMCDGSFCYLPGFIINLNQSGYALLFDKTLRIFYIHFCLTLSSNDPFSPGQTSYFNSLYSHIRNMLVDDDMYEKPSSTWADKIKQHCINLVKNEIKSLFNGAPEVHIERSFGYLISFFPEFQDFASSDFPEDFIQQSHCLDRIDQQSEQMKELSVYSENTKVFLGWQSSTFWGVDRDTTSRIFPVFINIQNLYYTLTQTVQYHIHRLYDQIFYQDRIELNTQILRSERMSLLIHKLRHIQRIFLSNLKPDQQQIYTALWKYWEMEENLFTFEKDLERCRLSLDQKMDIIQTSSDNRQNNLLFVIAIVQLLALLGVANDYFDLNDRIGAISTIALLSLSFITVLILFIGYLDRIRNNLRKKRD